MNNYETLFVLKPTLTDEETEAQISKVTEILEREGAKILATNKMGMRRLAYPVAKNERGFYTIIYFNAVGSVIAELERNLKFNEEVIKYLTVKYTKQKEIKQFNKLVAQSSVKDEILKAEEVTTEETPKEEATTNSVEA
ncbi:MAG TPA: 30S ribosomal protein S6 [Campylobacterales bacterium]|nr:30S ribosomal protein S6 [Campylobacterales bacterium]